MPPGIASNALTNPSECMCCLYFLCGSPYMVGKFGPTGIV